MSGWDGWKPFEQKNKPIIIWLVVLTILKNISQWEGLSHILWKIKNDPNHQPDNNSCFFSVRLIEQQWVFETPQPDQNDPFLGAKSATICVPLMFHDVSTGCTQQKTCKDKATSRALQLCSKPKFQWNQITMVYGGCVIFQGVDETLMGLKMKLRNATFVATFGFPCYNCFFQPPSRITSPWSRWCPRCNI